MTKAFVILLIFLIHRNNGKFNFILFKNKKLNILGFLIKE